MLMRCTWWHGQGRLGEQRAAHEQVEQAPGRNRGDQQREPGGEPTHRARQRAHRPEHQHHEHVADQDLGRQRHDSQDRRDGIGPGLPAVAQCPQKRHR